VGYKKGPATALLQGFLRAEHHQDFASAQWLLSGYEWITCQDNSCRATIGSNQDILNSNPTFAAGRGEVTEWQGHPQEQLNAMKSHLERLKQFGIEAVEE
jgi:hypothetical protein